MDKEDKIFPDDFFRKKARKNGFLSFFQSKPKEKNQSPTPSVWEQKMSSRQGISRMHIPHKPTAYRLSRKAHLISDQNPVIDSVATPEPNQDIVSDQPRRPERKHSVHIPHQPVVFAPRKKEAPVSESAILALPQARKQESLSIPHTVKKTPHSVYAQSLSITNQDSKVHSVRMGSASVAKTALRSGAQSGVLKSQPILIPTYTKVPVRKLAQPIPLSIAIQEAIPIRNSAEKLSLPTFIKKSAQVSAKTAVSIFLPSPVATLKTVSISSSISIIPLEKIEPKPKLTQSVRIPIVDIGRPLSRIQKPNQIERQHFASAKKTAPAIPVRKQILPKVQTVAQKQSATEIIAIKKQESQPEFGVVRSKIVTEIRRQLNELAVQNNSVAATKKPAAKRTHTTFFRRLKQRPKKVRVKKQRRKPSFFGEVVRFAVTSASIFAISFIVMNGPAISQLVSARIDFDPVSTVQKRMALEKMVSQEKFLAPILPTAGMKRETRTAFPQLDLNIAPLENRIVIPKIGKNVPVVGIGTDALQRSDWSQLENDIQDALKNGVVHYPGTAQPGQLGNVFITGHSSYYLWDPGKFKDVFARLHDLSVGDEFTIFWDQDVYHYQIIERKVVTPEETSVLEQPKNARIATLMTCTPIGTAKDRLILVAEQTN